MCKKCSTEFCEFCGIETTEDNKTEEICYACQSGYTLDKTSNTCTTDKDLKEFKENPKGWYNKCIISELFGRNVI